jgi:hypothetical protein
MASGLTACSKERHCTLYPLHTIDAASPCQAQLIAFPAGRCILPHDVAPQVTRTNLKLTAACQSLRFKSAIRAQKCTWDYLDIYASSANTVNGK